MTNLMILFILFSCTLKPMSAANCPSDVLPLGKTSLLELHSHNFVRLYEAQCKDGPNLLPAEICSISHRLFENSCTCHRATDQFLIPHSTNLDTSQLQPIGLKTPNIRHSPLFLRSRGHRPPFDSSECDYLMSDCQDVRGRKCPIRHALTGVRFDCVEGTEENYINYIVPKLCNIIDRWCRGQSSANNIWDYMGSHNHDFSYWAIPGTMNNFHFASYDYHGNMVRNGVQADPVNETTISELPVTCTDIPITRTVVGCFPNLGNRESTVQVVYSATDVDEVTRSLTFEGTSSGNKHWSAEVSLDVTVNGMIWGGGFGGSVGGGHDWGWSKTDSEESEYSTSQETEMSFAFNPRTLIDPLTGNEMIDPQTQQPYETGVCLYRESHMYDVTQQIQIATNVLTTHYESQEFLIYTAAPFS